MKMTKLLAGVAALALSAGAASADDIYQGAVQTNTHWSLFGFPMHTQTNTTNTGLVLAADIANAFGVLPGNTSLIVISGGAEGDRGNAEDLQRAVFTLSGSVSQDCAFFVGDASTDIDFGTIGIYTSEVSGPGQAFEMVDDASVTIETNLAGCNTASLVEIVKGNQGAGMVNQSGDGYDTQVFTAALPYSVTANYKATDGATAIGQYDDWIDISSSAPSDISYHGAWKSDMTIEVNIEAPTLALLAGDYSDTLTVTVMAQL